MDKTEASAILTKRLAQYQTKSYAELRQSIDEIEVFQDSGPTGVEYQIEVQIIWDDKPDGDIRVLAAIDDGGWRAFCPLSADLLVSPDHNDPD